MFNKFIPLDQVKPAVPFPVDLLPETIANYVHTVADVVQCKPDLPALSMLGSIAIALQRTAMVQVGQSHREPINLYLMGADDPSTRKSDAMQKGMSPVYDWQADVAKECKDDFDREMMRYTLQKGRLAKLQAKHAGTTDQHKADDIENEIMNMQDGLEPPKPPQRYIASDITMEKLASVLHENGGRLGVVDAEGSGAVSTALTRYSDATKLENFLKCYRGDPIFVDRSGRRETVFNPHLTLCLFTQPQSLRRIGKHPEARDQGFLARFLYAIPETTTGSRKYADIPINEQAKEDYRQLVRSLMRIPAQEEVTEQPQFRDLYLTGEGLQVWAECHDRIEARMAPGRDLCEYRDFGGKVAGHAVRLAGIFAIVEAGEGAIGKPIPSDCVMRACELIEDYFIPHGLSAFELMFDGGSGGLAEKVAAWITRHKDDPDRSPIFSKAKLFDDMRRNSSVPTSSALDDPLSVLVERGYIRLMQINADELKQKGRKAGEKYEINTILLQNHN